MPGDNPVAVKLGKIAGPPEKIWTPAGGPAGRTEGPLRTIEGPGNTTGGPGTITGGPATTMEGSGAAIGGTPTLSPGFTKGAAGADDTASEGPGGIDQGISQNVNSNSGMNFIVNDIYHLLCYSLNFLKIYPVCFLFYDITLI